MASGSSHLDLHAVVPVLLSVLMLCISLAAEPVGEPADVRVSLSSGASMNWTTMALEARSSKHGSGVAGRQQSSEQMARSALGPSLQTGIVEVMVSEGVHIADLQQDDALGGRLRNRVKLWAVSEARYYASGNVELLGELSVREYLKPWTLTVATRRPEMPVISEYTGVLLDARGLGVSPAFSPRILDEQGGVLYDGTLWTDAALDAVPVVYVGDLAHRAAARAGEHPMVFKVSRASGCDLVLDAADAEVYRRHLSGSVVVGEGRLVVVIDQ
ncbi:MAG: hypothetical protein ACI9MC_002548 [Kiritimatiellia bacterium]